MRDSGESTQQAAKAPAPESTPEPAETGHATAAGKGTVMRRSTPRTTRDLSSGPEAETGAIQAAAAEGTASPAGSLPHRAQLEGAFGLDLSWITAHTGPAAQSSAQAMGADAYATGDHVVVPPSAGPGLVAHEVTHVLQQQDGVQLAGGVDGGESDPLEREAESVASAVERGESVAHQVSRTAPRRKSAGGQVQRRKEKDPAPPADPAADQAEALRRMRLDRATGGLTMVTPRWKEALPDFFGDVAVVPDIAMPRFRQSAYNLIVQDRIDLPPVRSVLDAPGREAFSKALGDAEQAAAFDQTYLDKIREDFAVLVKGAQVAHVRARVMGSQAMVSPWGKRALAELPAFGLGALEAYVASGQAKSDGELEDKYLGSRITDTQTMLRAQSLGRGSSFRPFACSQLAFMVRTGAPALPATDEQAAPVDETAKTEEDDPEVQKKVTDLEAAINQAIELASAAAQGGKRTLAKADSDRLLKAIEAAGPEARAIVWDNKGLMSRLIQSLDPSDAQGLVDRLDAVERLYQHCLAVRSDSEDDATKIVSTVVSLQFGSSENFRESQKLIDASGVYSAIRAFLVARPGKAGAPMRNRLLEHTKLKDDFIDRLPADESRTIYRLIKRGTDQPTVEDRLHEAAEKNRGGDVVVALRELASQDPEYVLELRQDSVFIAVISKMTALVMLPDGQYVRPYDVCLVMWGMEPGEASDPGTIKLSEVDPTGEPRKPLTMPERIELETTLFEPALTELFLEISGVNQAQVLGDRKTAYSTQGYKYQNIALQGKHGDPQLVMDALVKYDRLAATPRMVELLRREGIVFGKELDKKYQDRYGMDLRTWVFENSGPNNRSGSNRVLGTEQGASVGMFNGQMLSAGEVNVQGKMTLHQALREHTYPAKDGKPIYEWSSVESREVARGINDSNKDRVLQHWQAFRTAMVAVQGQMESATGISPLRAIDLMRNAHLEHSGHLQTNLETRFQSKPADLQAIKADMGLTDDVDAVPNAPPLSITEQAERMYAKGAQELWDKLNGLNTYSTEPNYQAAGVLLNGLVELNPVPGTKPPEPGQQPSTVEERPPRTFLGYYRLFYGAAPRDHAAAVIRAIPGTRLVSAERAAQLLGIPASMVTGEVVFQSEDSSIGPHNRHLVRASFTENTARTKAEQIWMLLMGDGRMPLIMNILGEHNDEEQRLIRIAFRRLSGGLDLTFYVRQAMEARQTAKDVLTGEADSLELADLANTPKASVVELASNAWQYGGRVGGEGTAAARSIKKEDGSLFVNDGKWTSRSNDAQLEEMLSVATSGNLDIKTRIVAAIKRDSDDQIVRIVDELTSAERKRVLADGKLLSAMHGTLRQDNYERVFKVLTGQGDLADRLYTRSHGGSWSEIHIWGGTDEKGMEADIRLYIRQQRMKHNQEVRAEVTAMLATSSVNRPPSQQAIDQEVDRRVGEACAKIYNDKSNKAIMEHELDNDELAEMRAILAGKGTARDWAVAGGAGKAEILADIRAMPLEKRKERLADPNYMRLLGQRLRDEKDYRDAINALSEGIAQRSGLFRLEEASRSSKQAAGESVKADETMAALAALTRDEFEQLKSDPQLQMQVMRSLDDESQRQLVRDFLAGPPGAVVPGAVSPTAPASPTVPTPPQPAVTADGKAPAPAEKDPATLAKEKDEAVARAKEENIQYLIHRCTYAVRFPSRTLHSWSGLLEGAREVFKSDLPAPVADPKGAKGALDPKSPRRVVWDSVAADVAGFAAAHDVERSGSTAQSLTTQNITGDRMREIVERAVLLVEDPSNHLIESRIWTVDERNEDARRRKTLDYQGKQLVFTAGNESYSEESVTKTLNEASDAHVIEHWSTHMAGPPGGREGRNTLKARYDDYAAAFAKAMPAIDAREKQAKAAAKAPEPTPTATPTAVKGGGDAPIDGAAEKAKAAPEWTQGNHRLGDRDPAVAEAELKRRQFMEFQVNISAAFEEMLRPYMGDDRALTKEGTYDPDRAVIGTTKNKRYNTLVQVLMDRIPHLNPDVIAAKLGMAEHDRWLLKSGAREEGALMALTKQKNLRWAGAQDSKGGAAEEKGALDVTSFLYYRTFAGAMTDGNISGNEKEMLDYRRSENDRAREAYKTALETSAMWASLITSVLVTIAATILTGGLALGPMSMLAIGGVTALLSATAQAEVNKAILGDEFDSRDKKELITKEVITALVTMGTTYFAQRMISVLGKAGGKLFQQAGVAKQALGKPPTIWGVFLREASEEASSELMTTVVDAGLEATNPEHWVEGTKQGAKQAHAAAGAILSRADNNMWTAALTSIVTAGVSKTFRKGKAGNQPEFEAPDSGTRRRVNIKKNLKRAFGDPEEKFTGAIVEWAMSQEGPIDWENAPAELLQGLLQEYKEVGTETHVSTAQHAGRMRKADRHFAVWGHTLNQYEKDAYKDLNKEADDTDPFVTVQDYARIRTEVAVNGMTAWEGQNQQLTTAQRDEFVAWVREAETTDDLYKRAKSNPLEQSRVKHADVGINRMHQMVGKPLANEDTAREVMRDLADGKSEALRQLGIEPPTDFDSTKTEWGLGRRRDPATGQATYILIRGNAAAVDWSNYPGVEAIGHSHPDTGQNHLSNIDAGGGIDVRTLISQIGRDRINFLPSGADLVFVLSHGVQEHTLFTPFQSLGNGRIGNPQPGGNNAGVNIVMRRPRHYGDLHDNPEMPVVEVDIEIKAGNQTIYSGKLWGTHHPSMGTVLYNDTPPDLDVTPIGMGAQGGDHDDHPSRRPTQRGIPAQSGHDDDHPSRRRTQPHRVPSQDDIASAETGRFPAVDPTYLGPPPAQGYQGGPRPMEAHRRPTRQMQAVEVLNRDALAVADDFPELGNMEGQPAEVMFRGHQQRGAERALQRLSDQDYIGFRALLSAHTDPTAQAFLFKALAAGNSMEDVQWLADQIGAHDQNWMIDNLTLGDPRQVGTGIRQQWWNSCNASMTITLRGNADPVFALRMRLRNVQIGGVDVNDPTQLNMHQAELEREMLESEYGGAWEGVPQSGIARPLGGDPGRGRAADDLLNKQGAATRLHFNPQAVNTQAEAVGLIDAALQDGMQVPVVVGGNADPNLDVSYAHYVVAMARRDGPTGPEFLFHDVGDGVTMWISGADIQAGMMNLSGYTRIDALEVPSDIRAEAVNTAQPANRRERDVPPQHLSNATQAERRDGNDNIMSGVGKGKGRGLPDYAVKLSDVYEDGGYYRGGLYIEYYARTVDGQPPVYLGKGECVPDASGQLPPPSFTFDADTPKVDGKDHAIRVADDATYNGTGAPVPTGNKYGLSKLLISKFIESYRNQFGQDPDALGGGLAWFNKINFQREYYKAIRNGLSPDQAKVAAISSISYGTARIGLGYDQFDVNTTGTEKVDLGEDPETGEKLGIQRVPKDIKVVARRGVAPP